MASTLHGFERFLDYLKATLAIGVPIVGAVWTAVTYGLDGRYDDRYAPKALESAVVAATQATQAVADKVDNIGDKLVSMQLRSLSGEIIDTKRRFCAATTAESRQYHTRTLSDLIRVYNDIKQSDPYIPTCDEVQ